jgi:hypothetical protein
VRSRVCSPETRTVRRKSSAGVRSLSYERFEGRGPCLQGQPVWSFLVAGHRASVGNTATAGLLGLHRQVAPAPAPAVTPPSLDGPPLRRLTKDEYSFSQSPRRFDNPRGGGTTPVIGMPVVTGVARSDSGADTPPMERYAVKFTQCAVSVLAELDQAGNGDRVGIHPSRRNATPQPRKKSPGSTRTCWGHLGIPCPLAVGQSVH